MTETTATHLQAARAEVEALRARIPGFESEADRLTEQALAAEARATQLEQALAEALVECDSYRELNLELRAACGARDDEAFSDFVRRLHREKEQAEQALADCQRERDALRVEIAGHLSTRAERVGGGLEIAGADFVGERSPVARV